MPRNIIIRLTKAGSRTSTFSIKDSMENLLVPSISKKDLIEGIAVTIQDDIYFVTISPIGVKCCANDIKVPISTIKRQQLADLTFTVTNTASTWIHLKNTTVYNTFYGCISSYIIEYPFAYQYQDEILQNIKDYTKTFVYLPSTTGVFNTTRKIEINDKYFNKAILYNDQQSSGLLNLVPKPVNNMKLYLSYPQINSDSKTIIFTKSDNFYQYNTFWSVVKDKMQPLFNNSCESLSIDKIINQDNMNYLNIAYKKATLRAKDLKVRHILDNDNSVHLVSQFIVNNSQISYK